MRRFTLEEIAMIKRLRSSHKTHEIAAIMGRTKGSIDQLLHREKRKGAVYPKLRHGRLKYDCKKAEEWRNMVRKGFSYSDIKREQGIHPVTICRVLALEARNELQW